MGFFDNLKKKTEEAVKQVFTSGSKTVTFSDIPTTLEAFKALPQASLKDPYETAALAIVALNLYPVDKEVCYEMLNFVRGPRPLSAFDKSFIHDRLEYDGKEYVVRSYFEGSSPDNDYKPSEPYKITLTSNQYSEIDGGYLQLWVRSSGADNPRPVMLRNKPSTGEWFLWEHEGLLADIRIPTSKNEWA